VGSGHHARISRGFRELEYSNNEKTKVTQIAITALSLLVMIEALFWPIIMKPGTPLEWWQNFYLAKIGQYVGFPAWIVLFKSPFEGTLQLIIAWVLIILWTVILYWLIGAAIGLVQKQRK
jgi:hypothetical protein